MRRYIFQSLFSVLTAFAIGCATYRTPALPRSIWEEPSPILQNIQGEAKSLSLQQIWEVLISRNADLKTFRANVDITLDTPDIKGPLHCSGLILYQEPKNLRIIGSKFATTLFDITSDGTNFWLHIPTEKKFYTGTCNTFHRIEELGINIFPADLVTLFNYREILAGKNAALETWPTYWLVHLLEMDKKFVDLTGNLSLDRVNAEVFRCDLFNPDGSIRLQALFTNYTAYNDCRIPQKIDMRWPSYKTTLGIVFSHIEVNTPINPKVFTPAIPGGTQVINLN